MFETKKLCLGEVLTIPLDFVVTELRQLTNDSIQVTLYNETLDLEVVTYDYNLDRLMNKEED